MIAVKRPHGKGPEILWRRGLAGDREAALAAQIFGGRKRGRKWDEARKKFEFAVYKHPIVVEALMTLFHRKCAYCEYPYAPAQKMDVEHYRPKGGYFDENGKLQQPGYYWLALEWSNLLPSCIDCNRERTQKLQNGEERKAGKTNWFPLKEGSIRAKKRSDLRREKPLLLNPCSSKRADDPMLHLEFDDTGLIDARIVNGKRSERGDATIRICGLHRRELFIARTRHIKDLQMDMTFSRSLRSHALDEYLNKLEDRYLSPDRLFLAMTRAVLVPFLQDMRKRHR